MSFSNSSSESSPTLEVLNLHEQHLIQTMAFPTNGLYMIRNTGRNLVLDLSGNNTVEGTAIVGWADTGHLQAQRWIIRNQDQPGTDNKTISIQSNNPGHQGNGFFTANQEGERVQYTRIACLVDLVGRRNGTFTMSFTRGNAGLVLTVLSEQDCNPVTLTNYYTGDPHQLWEFIRM